MRGEGEGSGVKDGCGELSVGVGCWGEIVAKVRGTANIGDFAVSPVNFHRGSDDGWDDERVGAAINSDFATRPFNFRRGVKG